MNSKPIIFALIPFCAALNVGIGFIVQALKLPIYLDSIGTIVATALLGPVYGAITGVVGLVVLSLITTPIAIAYSGTAIAIAIFTFVFIRFNYLKNWIATIIFGLLLGVISAIISAPVTTFLFGGISFAGADAVTTFFKATGQTIFTSVFLGGIATDPVDKIITSICCKLLITSLPIRIRQRFPNAYIFQK